LRARSNRPRQIYYGVPRITGTLPERIGTQGGQTVAIKGENFSGDTTVTIGALWSLR